MRPSEPRLRRPDAECEPQSGRECSQQYVRRQACTARVGSNNKGADRAREKRALPGEGSAGFSTRRAPTHQLVLAEPWTEHLRRGDATDKAARAARKGRWAHDEQAACVSKARRKNLGVTPWK
eukprot:464216-Pleurochrysis_carterae.AAC.1